MRSFLLILFLALTSEGLLAQKVRQPRKRVTADCQSEFVRLNRLECKPCDANEVCVAAGVSESPARIQRKVTAALHEALGSASRVASGEGCSKAIARLAKEVTDTIISENKKLVGAQAGFVLNYPWVRSSILSAFKDSCGSCKDEVDSRLAQARELSETLTSLRPVDVKTNVDAFSDGVEPASCKKLLRSQLTALFSPFVGKPVEAKADPATEAADLKKAVKAMEDGFSQVGKVQEGSAGALMCFGGPEGIPGPLGALPCQKLSPILKPGDNGLCSVAHNDLLDFYKTQFLKNLNTLFTVKKEEGFFENHYQCKEDDLLGTSNRPLEEDKLIAVPCDACLKSTEILDLLSKGYDDQANSYTLAAKNYASSYACTYGGQLYYGIKECQEWNEKYERGTLYSNSARTIGPEALPALEQALKEFDQQSYGDDAVKKGYKTLNGGIRIPTTARIPGLNRKVCMTGSWTSYGKSLDMKEGRQKANEAAEMAVVYDRNFGQGAAQAVGNATLDLVYSSRSKEIDCVSLPARLIREALRADGCQALEKIRGYIDQGMRAQETGKTVVSTAVGIAASILAPGGLLAGALATCYQASIESVNDLKDSQQRASEYKRQKEIAAKNLREVQGMKQTLLESTDADISREEAENLKARAKVALESCVKAGITMTRFALMSKELNQIVDKGSKVAVAKGWNLKGGVQNVETVSRFVANNPALAAAVMRNLTRSEADLVDIVSSIPTDLRVRQATGARDVDQLISLRQAIESSSLPPEKKTPLLTKLTTLINRLGGKDTGKEDRKVAAPDVKADPETDAQIRSSLAESDGLEKSLKSQAGKADQKTTASYKAVRTRLYSLVLGRDPSKAEYDAFQEIHRIGDGEDGENGLPAGRGNYTYSQKFRKIRKLAKLKLHPDPQIDRAMKMKFLDEGILGTGNTVEETNVLMKLVDDEYNDTESYQMVLLKDVEVEQPKINAFPGKGLADLETTGFQNLDEITASVKNPTPPTGMKKFTNFLSSVVVNKTAKEQDQIKEKFAASRKIHDAWDYALTVTEPGQLQKLAGEPLDSYARNFVETITGGSRSLANQLQAWNGFFKVIADVRQQNGAVHDKALKEIFSALMRQDYFGSGVSKAQVLGALKQLASTDKRLSSLYDVSLRTAYKDPDFTLVVTLAGGKVVPGDGAGNKTGKPLVLLDPEVFDNIPPKTLLTSLDGTTKRRGDMTVQDLKKVDGQLPWGLVRDKEDGPTALAVKPAAEVEASTEKQFYEQPLQVGQKVRVLSLNILVTISQVNKDGTYYARGAPGVIIRKKLPRDAFTLIEGTKDGLSVGDRVYDSKGNKVSIYGIENDGNFSIGSQTLGSPLQKVTGYGLADFGIPRIWGFRGWDYPSSDLYKPDGEYRNFKSGDQVQFKDGGKGVILGVNHQGKFLVKTADKKVVPDVDYTSFAGSRSVASTEEALPRSVPLLPAANLTDVVNVKDLQGEVVWDATNKVYAKVVSKDASGGYTLMFEDGTRVGKVLEKNIIILRGKKGALSPGDFVLDGTDGSVKELIGYHTDGTLNLRSYDKDGNVTYHKPGNAKNFKKLTEEEVISRSLID